jgi:hypothetical protein
MVATGFGCLHMEYPKYQLFHLNFHAQFSIDLLVYGDVIRNWTVSSAPDFYVLDTLLRENLQKMTTDIILFISNFKNFFKK